MNSILRWASLFFLVVLTVCNSYAETKEKYYVIAIKGLALRDKPSVNAAKFELLNYGVELVKISNTNEYSTIDGIEKVWFEVKTENRKGYVWSGYLSEYKPAKSIVQYHGKYKEKFIKSESLPSSFELFADGKFKYSVNLCHGFNDLTGFWSVVTVNGSECVIMQICDANFKIIAKDKVRVYYLIENNSLELIDFLPKEWMGIGCDFLIGDKFYKQ